MMSFICLPGFSKNRLDIHTQPGSPRSIHSCENTSEPGIKNYFFYIALFVAPTGEQPAIQVMPDDHSELVPPLPIPNRTVKRLRADDSAATSVKVGHRQAFIKKPSELNVQRVF